MLISKWKLAEFPVLVRRQVVNMHCYPDMLLTWQLLLTEELH